MARIQYIDKPDCFTVKFTAACGMAWLPLVEEGTMAECRQAVARHLRQAKADGHPIAVLDAGGDWEIQEPEGCSLVPDTCGLLRIRPVKMRAFSCWECGELIPEGESCSCQEPWEEEQEEEQEAA